MVEKSKFAAFVEPTSQEKAMLVSWALCKGTPLRLRDVVAITGLSPRAARQLMSRAVRVLPVFKVSGTWRKLGI